MTVLCVLAFSLGRKKKDTPVGTVALARLIPFFPMSSFFFEKTKRPRD